MDNKLINKFDKTQKEIEQIEAQIVKATAGLQKKLTTLKEQDAKVREEIKSAMEKHDVKKFETDTVTITYVAPSERVGIDTKKLKEEQPKVWDKYSKVTQVKSSIRIKVHNG